MQLQAMKLQQQQQQQQQQQPQQPRQFDSDSTQRSQSSGSVAGVHSRSGSTVQQRASLPLHPNQPLGQVLAHPRPHPTVSVPSTPSASSASSSALPHSAANYASRTPSGTVAPSPSPGPGPLQLPAHPTTPSVGSAEAELEAAAGINLSKLSPKDLIFGKLLGEGSFAKVVECALRSDPSRKYACKIVDKHFVQKMGKVHTVMNEKKVEQPARLRTSGSREHASGRCSVPRQALTPPVLFVFFPLPRFSPCCTATWASSSWPTPSRTTPPSVSGGSLPLPLPPPLPAPTHCDAMRRECCAVGK
jgi:hypothetical protein